MNIVELLNGAGYETAEGAEAVLALVKAKGDDRTERLCSGYGVFPNGDRCAGCQDCERSSTISRRS